MLQIQQDKFFNEINNLLVEAGNLLLEYFVRTVKVTEKLDKSPVTEADIAVNKLICDKLQKLTSIPIVSEENSIAQNIEAAGYDEFWLIDPLDGTKSFLNKNQDFSICIAKIKNNRPVYGFIHVPFQQATYFSDGKTTYMRDIEEKVRVLKATKKDIGLHILSSHRMKHNLEFDNFIAQYDVNQISVISSAIKFCKVAEGNAQLYPYFADTMQWDSAAGDIIVETAGGRVCDLKGNKLFYGNQNNFVNPYFIVQA